ncbi:phage tail spike protein [Streptococcus suis]|uniref:phage tail spike protein n=8 Tax=Streptococcus suis TaxID=1307 RepID=UPI00211F243C|nr:phage tail spike protein [Streptococcus suis]
MLYLLDKDVKIVKWNGIPLHEASSAIVKEEVNGDFVLTVRYPITDSSIYQLIKEDMLIKAPTPVLGPQLFRIKKPVENDDSLDITAYHITDDIMQRSINPVSVVGQGCAMALSQMVQNAKTDLGTFSFTSDIMDSRTFNTTDAETLYSVLLDGKHSIVGTWEGELVRDNFALTIKRSRGNDRGVVITTHKNLKSYQRTKNSQNVVTRIHARSTFRAEGAEEETNISITVDSPLIGNYPYINEKEYQNNDIHSVEELRKWAERKFKYENIDKPTDEIKIEAYELDGQVVHLGDTVNIKSRKHDVDLYKKAIAYEYNALTEEYISITFDDKPGVGGYGVSSGLSNAADVILSANRNAQEVAFERAVKNANQAFDAEFEKRVEEINDGIEQSRAEAERHADNIKRSIDTEIAQVNQSMQAQVQEHDRQVADILSKTQSVESLANQAKSDAASALARANQVKTEAIADARAQVATVSQALNTAKTELQTAIANADQKARDSQASATALRNDLNLQASKILEQARAQTALTNRVSTVETLADGTRSTVAELSKTVSKATGDITSVSSRTKTVEDTLSQTRTQYEALTQTVNTQTGQIESINRKTADLQSGIDGVTERFENLRIEDNLLLNSSFNENLNQWQGTRVTIVDGKARITGEFNKTKHIYQSIKSQIANDDVSQVYIAAISVKVTNYVAGSINPFLALYISGRKNDSVKTWFGATYLTAARLEAVNNRGVVQFTTTFKVNVPRSQIGNIEFNIYARDFTGEVEFEKVSLRRGNIDLGWQASPEDLRSEIASYKRTADEASAELSRQIKTVDGKAVDAKTYAQQTATAINTRLESLETYKNAEGARVEQYFTASRDETARQVSALRVAVTQDYVAKSVFEETARGISQRFESLYVGGTNLLTGTDEYTEIFNSEQSHAEFLRTPYDLAKVFDKHGLVTYTLSFDLKADKDGAVRVYMQNGSGSKYSGLWKNLTVTTEWQRFHVTFTPTEGTVSLANSYLAFYGTYGTGVKPIIRRAKIERGAIATDWSPAPEDQQSYADTKIAEYKTTVDGRFATLQSQKANQVDLQTVRETVNLYERIIGSTETGIKDKVARMVMTDSLFLTEVKDKISGTATQVSQLNNSYAIKNLTSAGTVLNQINLLANGTNRIDGRLTHITGQTLIDNGVIKNAMIGELDAGKITSGTVDAARIKANSIDGSKIAFDEAFFNGLSANQAYLKKLFAKDAFLTAVQAVTLSASKISGGILTATNGAMKVNLNAGQILYYTDQAALKRVLNGYPTQFVKFATGTVTGKGNAGVTVIGSNRWNSESSNDGGFVGIRAWNGANIDQIDVVGDTVRLASSAFEAADGWNINTLPGKLDIDAFNAEHRASSKIKVGDLWLWKNATTYSSMRDTINLIIDNLQLLHNNKSTERGYSYTLPAKV